jgi:hypothetical protein
MTNISTKESVDAGSPKPENKKDNLKKLKEYHQPLMDVLGLSNAAFLPKLAYTPHGKNERYNALFYSEISKGVDICIAFADSNNLPQSIPVVIGSEEEGFEDNALYRWKFNPHYEEEYEKTEPNQTGHCRYLIPVSELVKLNYPTVEESIKVTEFAISDPDQDLPMSQMTMRDYAAIHMRKPISMKPWLNDVITK